MADKLDYKRRKVAFIHDVEPRMRKIYFQFYQETYKTSHLDRKTKELIAIAASLATHCKDVSKDISKKHWKAGATKKN